MSPLSDKRRRRNPRTGRNRVLVALAALVVAVAVSAAAWNVPGVRTVLLQSFTEQQRPYVELFFTSSPEFDGNHVVVPVSLNAHGSAAASYQVLVQLESASGKILAGTSTDLVPREGAPVPIVVRMAAPANAAVVLVTLPGYPQTLHFRLVN